VVTGTDYSRLVAHPTWLDHSPSRRLRSFEKADSSELNLSHFG